ncbi:MAG: AAA family ATPase [Rhodobacter sp.]|nr:AAA family ATPase [Rhodobacter sp.]
MIVGQPGSGKSTLARQLGNKTGLPVFHMDHLHWKPGWVERPMAEKFPMARAIEDSPEWVFEGGLSATYKTRLARADTLVVLDLPLWRRAWRVARRTLTHYGSSRPDLPENCPEKFSAEFWDFIWRTRRTGRARILGLIGQAGADVAVHHLRTPVDVRLFLRQVRD